MYLATTGTRPLVWIRWGEITPTSVPTCWLADDPRDRDRWDPPRVVVDRNMPRARSITRSIGGVYQRPRTDSEFAVAVERAVALHWWRGLSREMSRALVRGPRPHLSRQNRQSSSVAVRSCAFRREPGRPSRSRTRRLEAAR